MGDGSHASAPPPAGLVGRDALLDALRRAILPRLVDEPDRGDPIRIWVPGCGDGELVYAIAVVVLGAIADAQARIPVRIFGTDSDPEAIARARAGGYDERTAARIAPGGLDRFFSKTDAGWMVADEIRHVCIFGVQDPLRDPPLRRLDAMSAPS